MRWTWQQFHDAGGNGLRKLARADLVEEVRGELLSPLRVSGHALDVAFDPIRTSEHGAESYSEVCA
jgi:hypothetical protein